MAVANESIALFNRRRAMIILDRIDDLPTMNKFLTRIVAFLLVPVLLTDSSLVCAFPERALAGIDERAIFAQQALSASAIEYWHAVVTQARVRMIQNFEGLQTAFATGPRDGEDAPYLFDGWKPSHRHLSESAQPPSGQGRGSEDEERLFQLARQILYGTETVSREVLEGFLANLSREPRWLAVIQERMPQGVKATPDAVFRTVQLAATSPHPPSGAGAAFCDVDLPGREDWRPPRWLAEPIPEQTSRRVAPNEIVGAGLGNEVVSNFAIPWQAFTRHFTRSAAAQAFVSPS